MSELSIWAESETPSLPDVASGTAYELGTRFTSDIDGEVRGIRFFKGPNNTGAHTGHLWRSSDQALLGTVTFTGETASGWQQANFASPIAVSAGVEYVASYHTTTGFGYSNGYFASPLDRPPLHAPANAGVFGEGGDPTFPGQSFGGASYWVDVDFTTGARHLFAESADPQIDQVNLSLEFELGVRFRSTAAGNVTGIRFYKGLGNDGPHTGHLWDGAGNLLASVTFDNETASGWQEAALSPSVAIQANTDYVASYHTASGFAYDSGFFFSPHSNPPLSADNNAGVFAQAGFDGGGNPPFPTETNGGNYWVDVSVETGGACVPVCSGKSCGADDGCGGTCCAGSGCTPAGGCGECEVVNACGSDCEAAVDFTSCSGGLCQAGVCTSGDAPLGLFTDAETPANQNVGSGFDIEVGMRFTSSLAGNVVAMQFYKGAGNTGPHTGTLWDASGNVLATGTFTQETASGWQRLVFASPVAIAAGATHLVSYHTTTGFAYDNGFFSSPRDVAPLHAGVGAGVFAFGAGAFPNQVSGNANYWVDVDLVVSCTPSCSGVSCGASDGCGGTCCDGSGCTPGDCGECGVANACGSDCTPAPEYQACSLGTCRAGTCSDQPAPSGLFDDSETPGLATVASGVDIEVGVQFTSDVAGEVLGVQFFKGASNGGAHTGHLWDGSGNLLASGSFSGETASGWQRLTFTTPVAISASTVYTASYHTTTGFAYNNAFFTAPYDRTPLHVAIGGGVFAEGANPIFPTSEFGDANYWVDVDFQPGTGGGGGCTQATECPGSDTECQARTCNAGVCGVSNTGAGTPVASQTAGDCQRNVCDGAGGVTSEADDLDAPADAGECSDGVCSAGVPGQTPVTDGDPCSGGTCQSGTCVPTGGPTAAFSVVVIGDGAASLGAAASAVFIENRAEDGSPVGMPVVLPTSASGANAAFTLAGSATSEGNLSRSANTSFITLGGYDAAPGTASIAGTSAATVNRVVARIDAAGNIDTSTRLSDAFNTSNIRSATSDDGTRFWVSGTGSSGNGVRFAALGDTTSVQLATTPTNVRFAHIFGGQLYGTSGSMPFTNVFTVGTGLPTGTGQTATSLPGMPTTGGSPYSFVVIPANPAASGADTVYVADDRSAASGGGVQRWTFGSGTWTLDVTFTSGTAGMRGLAGQVSGSNVVLYASTAAGTTPNSLIKFTDDGGGTGNPELLSTSATNTVYRGVALAAQP